MLDNHQKHFIVRLPTGGSHFGEESHHVAAGNSSHPRDVQQCDSTRFSCHLSSLTGRAFLKHLLESNLRKLPRPVVGPSVSPSIRRNPHGHLVTVTATIMRRSRFASDPRSEPPPRFAR